MSVLHAEVRGRGGRDLVLLHGWGSNLRVFDSFTRALGPGWRTIAVDLPGHGRSNWDPRAAVPAAQTWRVHETLAAITERYCLLGWSLGGQFALDLATAMPGAIEALVLVSSTAKFLRARDWPYGTPLQLMRRLQAWLDVDTGRTVDDFLALQTRGTAPRTALQVQALLRGALETHGNPAREALRSGLARLAESDLREGLSQLQAPALVIAGREDRIVHPYASRALAAALPRARYALLAGASHAPFLSHTASCARLVRQFLT
ncbi:MAG: alpha/beta fold hydrolase [Proteobacteria bacterium]|nr:alpha/beta fold hydrolase [Pseudomonadota bacterium]